MFGLIALSDDRANAEPRTGIYLQGGINVDRGIGDEQRTRVIRDVESIHVAHAPLCSEAPIVFYDSFHQLISV